MTVTGTKQEIDWLFHALDTAGCCGGCPARERCRRTDEAEEAAGIAPHERIRCGDVLRKEIRASSGAAEDAVSELIREFIDAGHR